MMGFFNFLGKKNNESKKKTGGIKKQVMQVLNPKQLLPITMRNQRKKRVIVTLKKNQIIRSNLEMIYHAIFYGSKSWSETC